jgi:hypothetical protein
MCLSKLSVHACIAIAASLVGCTSAVIGDERNNRNEDLEAVREYVVSHRHWSIGTYTIKRRPDFGGHRVYDIINFDDYKRHYRNGQEVFESGRGKSFEVYYEPRTRKVIKEVWFQ